MIEMIPKRKLKSIGGKFGTIKQQQKMHIYYLSIRKMHKV